MRRENSGGYVFTEEMLILARFAKVFATGPEDPLKKKHCFFCILSKKNIFMKSRGLYALKSHYQRDCHLRIDQRFRERYCIGKVRGRDSCVLYGAKLEKGREQYAELDMPDLSYKNPFYYDVVDGKLFTFTTEFTRICTQTELLLILMKSGGLLWALDEYWTQVGVPIGHSASTADFNCSPSHISVSVKCFEVVIHGRQKLTLTKRKEKGVSKGATQPNFDLVI